MNHELVLLSKAIDWKKLEEKLSVYYSHTGKPSMPVRLMVSCLLLKRLYNLVEATLTKKTIDKCNSISTKEKTKQRQSYKRVSKQLLRDSYNGQQPKREKKAKKSQKK